MGLTGAIGAGKSTVSKQFQSFGIPVHCADEEIHKFLENDRKIQEKIRNLWPSAFVEGRIKRALLGEAVLKSPTQLGALEEILYPALAKSQKNFLNHNKKIKTPVVILDVPLLIEVGLYKYCNKVIVVEAPFFLRKWRVLNRLGMTFRKLKKFESHQYTGKLRRKYANFLIPTGRGKRTSLQKISNILSILSQEPSPSWTGEWPLTLKREIYDKRSCS